MKVGTWNVQGIGTKKHEVFQELENCKIDICALTETKKKGEGTENVGKYIYFYSGVSKDKRAKSGIAIAIHKKYKNHIKSWENISERFLKMSLNIYGYELIIIAVYFPTDDTNKSTKDEFEEQLTSAIENINPKKEIILLGDFNGRTGRQKGHKVIGQHGEEVVNDNGERLINICEKFELKIMNGFYKHKEIHKYTWGQPTKQQKSIIDYIIIKQNSHIKTQDVRVKRGAVCGSDHFLLVANLLYKYHVQTKSTDPKETKDETETYPTYNLNSLNTDSTKFLYQLRLCTKTANYNPITTANEKYEWLKKFIHQSAKEALGASRREEKRNQKWIDDETLELINNKKEKYHVWLNTSTPENWKEYVRARYAVKKEIIKKKNETWQSKCAEIENFIGGTRAKQAWKILKNIRQDVRSTSNLQIISMEKQTAYYEELLKENRNRYKEEETYENNEILQENELQQITVDEINWALRGMKNGKSPGPGGICIELVKHAPTQAKEILADIFNCCLIKGENIPNEWRLSHISSIYKKGDKTDCSNYRGISVTSSIGRLYGRIIKRRIEEEWEDEEEQSGFRSGRSCVDNTFCLQQLTEKRCSRGQETHMVFVDLKKAYDTVPRKKLFEVLQSTKINNMYLKTIKDIYRDNKAAVKMKNQMSYFFKTSKGLLQGCCLSPTLFKIYLYHVLKKWKAKCGSMGIPINEQVLHTLLFADDQVVIAGDRDDINYMTRKLKEEYDSWGLEINTDKTVYLTIGAEGEDLELEKNVIIKKCSRVKYLGVVITDKGNNEEEIRNRITQGKKAIQKLNSVLWSKDITKETKKRMYKSIVEGITLYGAEIWELTEKNKRKLEALEMDCLRRSCRVTRLEKVPNTKIREMMKTEDENIIHRIETRRLKWFGHVKRMDDSRWPYKMETWVPTERRKRGRPRKTWRNGVNEAMQKRDLDEEEVHDREIWRKGCEKRL